MKIVIKLKNKIYNKIRTLHNLYIKERSFLNKKSYASDEIDQKVINFFKNKFNGIYVDVGCYHPTKNNNTYLLYKKFNWRGVNIDVSKFSIDLFNYWRTEDKNIRCGITSKKKYSKLYYQKDFSLLSTLSKTQSKNVFHEKVKCKLIRCDTLTNILDKSIYKEKKIDFLTIDTEGNDLNVLKSLNFKIYDPSLICVEDTNLYYKNIDNIKNTKVFKFLSLLNYTYMRAGIFDHFYFK